LIGWFNSEFISTNKIDKRHGKTLRNAYQNRRKGDYDAFVDFTLDEVEIMLQDMNDLDQILSYLATNKDRLQRDYHLTKIGVFGSIVRNDQNSNSDIDLIVEFEENTPDLYSIKRNLRTEIQNKFRRSVDIFKEKYLNPFFKNRAIAEARYA
jgi:predicted nucleotidyltransferase